MSFTIIYKENTRMLRLLMFKSFYKQLDTNEKREKKKSYKHKYSWLTWNEIHI